MNSINKKVYTFKDANIVFSLTIAFQLLMVVIYSVVIISVASAQNIETDEALAELWIVYFNLFFSELVFFVVYFLFNFFKRKDFAQATRISFKLDWKVVLLVISMAVILMLSFVNFIDVVNLGITNVFSKVYSSGLIVKVDSIGRFLIAVLLLAFLPAAFEELIFRGIIFNGLLEKCSVKKAIILSSLVFMIIHMNIYQTVYQFILGICLGIIFYLTSSIIYPMIFHFVNNFMIVFCNFIIETTGKNFFEFSNFNAIEIVYSILIALAGVALIYLLMKLMYKRTSKLNIGIKSNMPVYEVDASKQPTYLKDDRYSKLSDYEKRQLGLTQKVTVEGWFWIIFAFCFAFWFINSFGELF